MFNHIGVTSPAPAGCMVEFTLYGDEQQYMERAENIAWHIVEQTEGRVRQYRVLSGGDGWMGREAPAPIGSVEYLYEDGSVSQTAFIFHNRGVLVGWRPCAAPPSSDAGPSDLDIDPYQNPNDPTYRPSALASDDESEQTVLRGRRGQELIAAELTLLKLNYAYEGGETWQPPPAEPVPTRAPALLDQARCHMEDRAATYDQPEGERSMGKTVEAFNVITGRDLSESEGWLLMQILKDVRDRQRIEPHRDSLEDGIAYAALKAEARLAGR